MKGNGFSDMKRKNEVAVEFGQGENGQCSKKCAVRGAAFDTIHWIQMCCRLGETGPGFLKMPVLQNSPS